jgi:hypothetical protein
MDRWPINGGHGCNGKRDNVHEKVNNWNILITSFFNHLNGKSKSRKLVPIDEEDVALNLSMQERGDFF